MLEKKDNIFFYEILTASLEQEQNDLETFWDFWRLVKHKTIQKLF